MDRWEGIYLCRIGSKWDVVERSLFVIKLRYRRVGDQLYTRSLASIINLAGTMTVRPLLHFQWHAVACLEWRKLMAVRSAPHLANIAHDWKTKSQAWFSRWRRLETRSLNATILSHFVQVKHFKAKNHNDLLHSLRYLGISTRQQLMMLPHHPQGMSKINCWKHKGWNY